MTQPDLIHPNDGPWQAVTCGPGGPYGHADPACPAMTAGPFDTAEDPWPCPECITAERLQGASPPGPDPRRIALALRIRYSKIA